MNFLKSLNRRYAALPTSSGLQPFTIISISDKALLEKIRPIAYDQPQITAASQLLVFAAWDDITGEKIDEVFEQMIRERDLPANSLDNYRDFLKSRYASMTQEERFQSAARQAYVAFGIAIAAAATDRIDATPMEGFRNAHLDELLGLKEKGLRSVTLLALGCRDEENDWLLRQKKACLPKNEMIIG